MMRPEEKELHTVYRERANAALARGHAALRPSPLKNLFWAIFGYQRQGEGNYDAAAEHFKAAAGGYQMVKDWAAATQCLRLYAEALIQVGQPGLAAGELVEAAHCCTRAGDDAAPLRRLAADTYLAANRFDRAAKCVLELATAAKEENDAAAAAELFAEAADLFEKTAAGGDSADCRHCRIMLAELAASDAEAAEMFERLGRDECVGRRRHGGASYLAKKFFLQSLICHLALGDAVQARQKQVQFADLDFSFPGSRENDFATQLIAAMDEEGSTEAFAEACADYDRVTPLDTWKTTVLLRAKRHIVDGGDEDDPDLR